MLIPHKGKNKGKYISFHYLRGWKASKIRKVQEISPQIPIFQSHYIGNTEIPILSNLTISILANKIFKIQTTFDVIVNHIPFALTK